MFKVTGEFAGSNLEHFKKDEENEKKDKENSNK